MDIRCNHCNGNFVLPDDRVPESKKFKLNCPKCREPIIVEQSVPAEKTVAPEYFPHDATVAFLFVRQPSFAQRIRLFLKPRGIFVSETANINEALDRVRVNYYNILILEDSEFTKSILEFTKKWNGLRRRDVNIIMVDAKCDSLHPNEAFVRGVNSVIGTVDNERIEQLLDIALSEHASYMEPWKLASEKLLKLG